MMSGSFNWKVAIMPEITASMKNGTPRDAHPPGRTGLEALHGFSGLARGGRG